MGIERAGGERDTRERKRYRERESKGEMRWGSERQSEGMSE